MPTPTPPAPADVTPTDIYDRLRGIGRRARRAPLAVAVVAALAGAGCATPPPTAPLPLRVCGDATTQPVRLADEVCTARNAPADGAPVAGPSGAIRWWVADARCLDPDDYTAVGDDLDDDYRGEPCDPTRHTTRRSAPSVVTTPPVATSTPTARRTPPPSTARTSTPATRKPTTTTRRSR